MCESIQCIVPQMTIVHCQATGDSKMLIILSTPITLDTVAIEPPNTPTSQSEEFVHPAPTFAMQQVDTSEREEKYEAVASSVSYYVRIAIFILWGMIRLVYVFVLWLFSVLFENLAVNF